MKIKRLHFELFFLITIVIGVELICYKKLETLKKDILPRYVFIFPYGTRPGWSETIIDWKTKAARKKYIRPFDLIVIGDSSGVAGVISKKIETETGLSTLNLATISYHSIEGHFELLKYYIKNNGMPKRIIYHISCSTFNLSAEDIKSNAYLSRYYDLVSQLDASSKWPSYNLRPLIVSLEKKLFEKNSDVVIDSQGETVKIDHDVRSVLEQENGTYFLEEEGRLIDYTDFKYKIHDVHINDLKKIIDFCEINNIKLEIVVQPMPTTYQKFPVEKFYSDLEEKLKQISSNAKNTHIGYPILRFYDAALPLSHDIVHLLKEGAIKNTDYILNLLNKTSNTF